MFVGRVGGLCCFLVKSRDCAVWNYSRGTVLFVGTVEGQCCLSVQ